MPPWPDEPRRSLTLVLLTALGAELGRSVRLGAAAAAFALLTDARATFGAELSALRLCTAARALRGDDLLEIALAEVVDCAGFLVDLLSGGFGLRGRDLLVHVRRAMLAEPGFLVPAHWLADPASASGALLEQRADLAHGVVEGGVVLRAARVVLDHARRLRCSAKDPAEDPGRHVGGARQVVQLVRHERRHVAVPTLAAVELELKAPLRGEIG